MAEPTQPGKAPIGIIKGPAPKTPPQTQTVIKSAEQLLREATFREGYNKGLHEKGMRNFWHGMGVAIVLMAIGSGFTYFVEASNREQGMVTQTLAVDTALSTARKFGAVIEPPPASIAKPEQ